MKRMYARERTRRKWAAGRFAWCMETKKSARLPCIVRQRGPIVCILWSANETEVFTGRSCEKGASLRGLAKATCAALGRIDEPAHVTYEND